jgi:hypothetical protein
MIITPSLLLAVAWMLLLGWGFHILLKRHLQLDDKLADMEDQLALERQAREVAEAALANARMTLGRRACDTQHHRS